MNANAETKAECKNFVPKIRCGESTADKIQAFLPYISEENLQRIYRFVKYIYFQS